MKLSFTFWLKSTCSLNSADKWEELSRGRSLFREGPRLEMVLLAALADVLQAARTVGGWEGSTVLVTTLLCSLSFHDLQSYSLLPRDTLKVW